MNKRICTPIAILLAVLFVSGCGMQIVTGSGNVKTESRNVRSFSGITLAGIGDVYVTQGENSSVRIEAEDNLIPYFDTSVSGSTLNIGIKNQYLGVILQPTKPVKFYVTTPKITSLTLFGSGNIFAGDIQAGDIDISVLGSGNITTDNLAAVNVAAKLAGSGNIALGKVSATEVTANIAGSGNIKLATISADKVSATTSGSGSISISGKVTDQQIAILGSGDYLASGLKSETANVRVTGSGNSEITVSETLDVTILGSGDVHYSGSPRINVSTAGSGKAIQIGD